MLELQKIQNKKQAKQSAKSQKIVTSVAMRRHSKALNDNDQQQQQQKKTLEKHHHAKLSNRFNIATNTTSVIL